MSSQYWLHFSALETLWPLGISIHSRSRFCTRCCQVHTGVQLPGRGLKQHIDKCAACNRVLEKSSLSGPDRYLPNQVYNTSASRNSRYYKRWPLLLVVVESKHAQARRVSFNSRRSPTSTSSSTTSDSWGLGRQTSCTPPCRTLRGRCWLRRESTIFGAW